MSNHASECVSRRHVLCSVAIFGAVFSNAFKYLCVDDRSQASAIQHIHSTRLRLLTETPMRSRVTRHQRPLFALRVPASIVSRRKISDSSRVSRRLLITRKRSAHWITLSTCQQCKSRRNIFFFLFSYGQETEMKSSSSSQVVSALGFDGLYSSEIRLFF